MLKRIVIFLLLNAACFGFVYSQQLARIAVVDLARVYTEFLPNSTAVRNFETRSATVQREIDRMQREIQTLRSRHADAIQQGNQSETLRLEADINRRTDDLRQYHQTRTAELDRERRNLMQSGSFLNEVNDEIRLVAERGGFTHVFNIGDTPGLIWYHSSFDITENLIEGLRRRSRN